VTNPSAKPRTSGVGKFDAVPMLDLARQYRQIREEVLSAIERVCASQQYILGQEVAALEREIAVFTGATDAVACASGTDALWLALLAAGVQPGDAVVTTAFSFFASASSIVRIGARPVFVDIDPSSFNLDPVKLASKLKGYGPRVKAILTVHLYGQCAEMDAIGALASEFNVQVVEDAAQAIGASWKKQRAGSLGLAAAFSFYPTKNLSAYGDAGLVTTLDPGWAERMRQLRNHGSPQRYLHTEVGWNCRMDAIQAAVLPVKLPHIEEWNHKRRERAKTYDRLLEGSGLIKRVSSLPTNDSPVVLHHVSPNAYHVFHQYVLRVHRRDELRAFLSERKISTEVYYPIPLHLQPCFEYLGYRHGDLPESELASKQVLALPMFPELTEGEQKWVVENIAEFHQ